MKLFNNLKIKTKLVTGFSIVAIISIAMGVFSIFNINKLNAQDTVLYKNMTVPLDQIGRVSTAFQRIRVNSRDMIIANTDAEIEENIVKIGERRKEVDDNAKLFKGTIVSKEMTALYQEFEAMRINYKAELDKVIVLAKENKDEEALSMISDNGSFGKISREEQDLIDKILAAKVEDAKTIADSNTKMANSTTTTTIIVMGVVALLSILIGLFIAGVISKAIKKTLQMIEEMSKGHLDKRLNLGLKDEIGMMAKAMDSFADFLQNTVIAAMDKISKGDMSSDIKVIDEKDQISPALITTITSIKALVEDANTLANSAVEGKLSTRADASKHRGDFKNIVEGVNNTLDSVVGHLNMAAEYIDRISKGDIPDKITDTYNGDFNLIKNNLNTAIDAINAMVTDANMLVEAAVEGKLSTRADATKHMGDFRKIVEGVNKILDEVIKPLSVAYSCIVKLADGEDIKPLENIYKGDFALLIDNLNKVRAALYVLLGESEKLAKAGVSGELSVRGDISKIKGGYAQIVIGINDTLDAITKPINEVNDVMGEISKGNLGVLVRGDYKGDFAELKDSVNNTASSLKRVVGEISDVIGKIADGDLVVDRVKDYDGDFLSISNSLNNIVDSLNDVLGEINTASEQVSAGSKQVSDSSQALSQGSTEQASSIEEVTAAITEIASQIKENANNANNANGLATSAKENATTGKNQMGEMLNAMDEINTSSANISKIIKVIDEIAFQTNILALNAAVEAARAGQYGKGFAVVAEEVRNLAARSAQAAKETTSMIEESIKKAGAGKKIAEETAGALNKIVDNIAKVADIVGDIAEASNEEATGVAQINQAVEEISKVTQTNTATAEESASASEELWSQSVILKDRVSKFKLKRRAASRNEYTNEVAKRDNKSMVKRNSTNQGEKEVAATTPRIKIDLDDRDFGKY